MRCEVILLRGIHRRRVGCFKSDRRSVDVELSIFGQF